MTNDFEGSSRGPPRKKTNRIIQDTIPTLNIGANNVSSKLNQPAAEAALRSADQDSAGYLTSVEARTPHPNSAVETSHVASMAPKCPVKNPQSQGSEAQPISFALLPPGRAVTRATKKRRTRMTNTSRTSEGSGGSSGSYNGSLQPETVNLRGSGSVSTMCSSSTSSVSSHGRRPKLPSHIHDRVLTYASHMLRTFNSGNLPELIAAVDRACSSRCVLRTRLVKNQNEESTFADINVARDRIVDFFRGISEAFPDAIFQTHMSRVQASTGSAGAFVVATKYSFSGTMIKSVYEDRVEGQFDVVDTSVLPRLQSMRPSTQSVLATGTILLTLGPDYKADTIDMNYVSNCRIVSAALMG
jgi:hypothetical protein